MLGVEDYGIFNIVSGLVVMLSFLNNAMITTTQRFINFALGQNDTEQVKNVYSISFIICISIAAIIVIIAQTIGLWFFFTWLNLPLDRQNAAFVVYQLSILAVVISVLQTPYRATIIAYEKMSFFALLSIIEAVLRLGIVFMLSIIHFDRLIVYAFLACMVGIVIFFIYKVFCNKMFETARFKYSKDKKLFKQFVEFSKWSVLGNFSMTINNHGTNVLLNFFYGVLVNAAIGIANQVNSAASTFVANFQTAFNPQIIKSYSAKEYDYFIKLIFWTSKLSFYLLFIFVLPFYINADFVLQIWLKNVPEYTVAFTRILLLSSLVNTMIGPLVKSMEATGNIKKYQLIECWFIFANLPLSFIFLRLGFSPVWVVKIQLFLIIVLFVWRMFFISKRINLPVKLFFCKVIVPMFFITVISSFVTMFFYVLFTDWTRLIVSCVVSTLSIVCLIYFIGLNTQEKLSLKNWIRRKITITRSIL
jgi:O-antigen/teichoic acid export membrane protein